jgi:hypothetical protein
MSHTGMAAESRPSRPVEVRMGNLSMFLDSNRFSRPERGDPARSESERIVEDKPHATNLFTKQKLNPYYGRVGQSGWLDRQL